jgi:uncharacterized protein YrrD
MEKLYSTIIGTHVFEDDALRPLTTIKDVVLDPERGKIIVFIVDINKNLVIAPIDVLSWSYAIKIRDASIIIEGNEILRVEEVQKKGIRVVYNRVETENGLYLGKVYDFSVDEKTFELRKIFVAKGILGIFRYDSKIISAKNIIEVLPEKIVVKNTLEPVKEETEGKVSIKDAIAG